MAGYSIFSPMLQTLIIILFSACSANEPVHYLSKRSSLDEPFKSGYKTLCYNVTDGFLFLRFLSSVQHLVANPQHPQSLWKVTVTPKDAQEEPIVFFGANATEVEQKYKDAGFLYGLRALSPWGNTDIRLSTIEHSCIGVETGSGFTVTVKDRTVDVLYLAFLIVGVFLFLAASQLSRSVFFHYSTGVTIGILASLLILVYILSRFIPKKIGAGVFLCGGWAVILYLFKWIAENLITSEYRDYILIYFIVAGVISFAVCYWYGPVTNVRTMHLIQGLIQLVGALCIYSSCQYRPVGVTIIAVLITYSFFPLKYLPRKIRYFSFFRWSYPKPRLLTVQEFEEQSRIETKKALEELREFCRSPKVDAWKMIAKMDSPKRFAEFVTGESHVSQDEITLYESDISLPGLDFLTSDSDSEDDT